MLAVVVRLLFLVLAPVSELLRAVVGRTEPQEAKHFRLVLPIMPLAMSAPKTDHKAVKQEV